MASRRPAAVCQPTESSPHVLTAIVHDLSISSSAVAAGIKKAFRAVVLAKRLCRSSLSFVCSHLCVRQQLCERRGLRIPAEEVICGQAIYHQACRLSTREVGCRSRPTRTHVHVRPAAAAARDAGASASAPGHWRRCSAMPMRCSYAKVSTSTVATLNALIFLLGRRPAAFKFPK